MQKNTGMHECKWSALPPTYLENYIRQRKKIDFLLLFQVSGNLSNEGHVRWNRCQENCETLYSETWGLACSSFRSRLTVYIYRCLKAFMDRERDNERESFAQDFNIVDSWHWEEWTVLRYRSAYLLHKRVQTMMLNKKSWSIIHFPYRRLVLFMFDVANGIDRDATEKRPTK